MRYVKYLIFLLAYQFAYSTAMAAPSKFVYQGQIIKPNGQPLESANVEFIVEIFSPGGEQCLLYQERHVLNLINSNGLFSLTVGEGTRSGSDFEDTSTLNQAFNNFIGTISSATCAAVGTYTPGQADSRRLRIKFDNGSGLVTIPQDQWIHSVPFAQQASSIDGITSAELLRVNETGSLELTQNNLEQVFDGPNFTELIDLINGTSSQYLASGSFSAPLDLNSQKIANLADPTVGTDATNKNYVDQNFGGAELDLTGLADGQTLVWNATDSKWEVQTFSSTDNTKLPLAGGQMSGGIDMNGNAITNATNIGASNNLTVGNDLTVTNDISVTQDLSVGNDTTINNNLSVGAGISVVGGIGVGTGINSAGNIHIQDSQELRLGDADNSHYVGFKAPALVTAGASFVWELPAADGTSGQLLQTNGGGVLSWVDPPVGTLVSVSNQGAGVGIYDNTNSGDVELRSLVAASSKVSISLDAGNKEIDIDVAENNFDSSLIPNTASGSITATNVQAAINELDTNKVATGFTITTAADSGLTGGGDLSTNRSLSIDIAGTTDLGAPADNADSLLLRDNTDGSLKEVTRAQLVLSETEVDSMVSNNGYAVGSEIFKHDGSVAMTGNINTNNNSILNLELGSPAAPSISFNGDDNTGIFSPAPNSVAISTDGNEALSIDSNGRVGIGTTTPSGRLDIEGGDVFIGTGTLTNASGADDLSVTGNIEADGNVYANAFYGDGSNLTGISITPPLSDVASATSTNFIDNLNYNQNWIWSTATTETAMSMNAGNLTSGTLLRLNSSGTSLSAQTSSATANAIVGSNTAINGTAIRGHSEAGTGFGIGVHGVSDSLTGTGIYGEMYVDNNTANGVQGNNFGATNDGSGVYGANNGASNLGYGVFGENSSSTGIGVRGYNSSSGIGGFFSSASGNALITGSGNVGIGTDTPSGKLDIEGGDVFIGPATLTNASANEDLSVTGNIEVDGIIYGDGSGITNISANGIDHDSLSGFVANEHIDHSTVFIATSANSGLSGGGNITTTRNIAIDIAGTDDLVGLVDNADSLLIRDNTDGSLKEITRAQLVLSETEVDALVSNNGYLTSFSETDPKMQTLSSTEVDQLENIDAVTISNAQWGYLGNMSAQPLESVTGTVLDNVFSSNGLLKRTGAGTYVSVTDNSANWDAAYSSVNTNAANWNTAFGWGDHSAAGYAADSAVFKHNGTVAMTGNINANDNSILNLELGSAAAPSISFNGDDNTGIFSPAPDSFAISTAGNEAFTIDSSGYVGIGTNSPDQPLHILSNTGSAILKIEADPSNSDENHNPYIHFSQDGGSTYSYVGHGGDSGNAFGSTLSGSIDNAFIINALGNGIQLATEDIARMTIALNGNVGIATNNPSRLLHVNGAMRMTASTTPAGAATGDLFIDSADSNKLKWYDGSTWQEAGGGSVVETDPKMQTLSSSEVDQLENIDAVTISNAQWGYLGNMSAQPLETVTGTVLDNVFSTNGLLKRTGAGTYVSVTDNSANWDAAYSSVNTNAANWNTAFGWGDHSAAGYAADSAVFKHNGTVAMTGDINLNNNSILNLELGTAAAPSISFNGDDNTGIFSPAPDSFAISTAGTESFTILSNGNVGIGTSNPGSLLDVKGNAQMGDANASPGGSSPTLSLSSSTRPTLMFEHSGNDTSTIGISSSDYFTMASEDSQNGIQFKVNGDYFTDYLNTAIVAMTIDNSGNVGIGSSSPTAKLDVNGAIKATSFEGAITSSNVSVADGSAAAPSMTFSSDSNTGFYSSALDQIGVSVAGNNIFDFSAIGLSSPTTGGATLRTGNGTNATPTFSFSGDEDTGMYRSAADTISFATGGSERMTLASNGRVGIGTSNPGRMLHVYEANGLNAGSRIQMDADDDLGRVALELYRSKSGAVAPSAGFGTSLVFQNEGFTNNSRVETARIASTWEQNQTDDTTTRDGALGFYTSENNSSTQKMVLNSAGNLGIGTNNPQNRLHLFTSNTSTASGEQWGEHSQMNLNSSGNQTVGAIRGAISGRVDVAGANTKDKVYATQGYLSNSGTGNIADGAGLYGMYSNVGNVTSGQGYGVRSVAYSWTGDLTWLIGNYNWTGIDGGTVFEQVGVYVDTYNTGGTVTNRYGVYLDAPNDTGGTVTNDYGIYQEGTQDNYFAGNIGIGTNKPTRKLAVAGDLETSGDFYFKDLNATPAEFDAISLDPYVWNTTPGAERTGLSVFRKEAGAWEAVADFSSNLILYNPIDAQANWSYFSRAGDNTYGHWIEFFKSRGTYDTPTQTLQWDDLGNISAQGYTSGGDWSDSWASMTFAATQNYTPTANGSEIYFSTTANNTTTPLKRMTIAQNGFVGIGTATPSHILHINGQGRATNSAWATTSDIRLKDVQGEYAYGLNEILNIPTYRFKYKKGNEYDLPTDKEFIGTVAQELQQAIPEAVEEDQNGYLTVNTDPVFWATINAVQELHGMCKMSDEQIAQLKSKDQEQDRKIASLEEENAKKDKEIESLKLENQVIKNYLCSKDPNAAFCQ